MKFVFDIDGTLCFNGKSIDPSIVDALLQLQNSGHELIIQLASLCGSKRSKIAFSASNLAA